MVIRKGERSLCLHQVFQLTFNLSNEIVVEILWFFSHLIKIVCFIIIFLSSLYSCQIKSLLNLKVSMKQLYPIIYLHFQLLILFIL